MLSIEPVNLTMRDARLSSGTSHVGDGSAVLTLARASAMVASVRPCCASPPITARGARAATPARGPTSSTALAATEPSQGGGQNPSTMDTTPGAHLPLAKGFPLRGRKPDVDAGSWCAEMGKLPAEELAGSLTLGREGLSGLPHHQQPPRSGVGEGRLIYPPYLIGVPMRREGAGEHRRADGQDECSSKPL
jgi:hypothetical protein